MKLEEDYKVPTAALFMYENWEIRHEPGKNGRRWGSLNESQLERAVKNGDILDRWIASRILLGRKEREED